MKRAALRFAFCLLLLSLSNGRLAAQPPLQPRDYDRLRVGQTEGGRVVVATNQVLAPLGRQVAFPGRPTDVAWSPDGRFLAVLCHKEVLLLDPAEGTLLDRAAHAGGSYAGLLFTPDGRTLLASSLKGSIGRFGVTAKGRLEPRPPILVPAAPENPRHDRTAEGPSGPQGAAAVPGAGAKNPLPLGLALGPGGTTLWAVLNLRNSLVEIDLEGGTVRRRIPVGNAPYGVALAAGKAYVSNWAGRHPAPGEPQGPSGSGTPVRVDPLRHIASDGTVSVVDLQAGRELGQLPVGLHPSGIAAAPDGRFVAVANANSDTVSVIDTAKDEVVETLEVRPAGTTLFGSSPNAVAFAPDGATLYVSNATNNAIAVVAFRPPRSKVLGFLPSGWYPAGLALDREGRTLAVANVKGVGSRAADWKGRRKVKGGVVFGYNSHDYQGTLSIIPVPPASELAGHTRTVEAMGRLSEAESALAPPRAGVAPRPVPRRHGEPSLFRHVVYVIKENRTYDQVLGDLPQGEGASELCLYGREVTPNTHKLAEEFVLLDNFYCCGTLSADGHQWATQAYVTDYLEKAFGGWPRSYPYWGGDAMAYASSGFLWDGLLARGGSLRVYGEFVKASVKWRDPKRKGKPGFLDCYRDFMEGTSLIEVRGSASIASLEPHVCPTTIGFPSIVPDVYRAAEFIRELEDYQKRGRFPDLAIVLLPNDHTSGTRPGMPTPEAAVADNDLALGRIVEALSRSRFWPQTCVFVVQDDPQDGFDHIDGRRTVALVASPYTRRGAVVSTNYNQTSMVRTIELILGLPPMNQLDAAATPMADCFTDAPDSKPFAALPNTIPLDKVNPEVADLADPSARRWAAASLALPLDDVDQADEGTLNRILWHAARGRDDTYPVWAVNAAAGEAEDDAPPPAPDRVSTLSLLEELADLERLARLPERPYRSVQFSSHDRRSTRPEAPGWFANGDGFGGERAPGFAAVLEPPGQDGIGLYLVAEVEGPGAIVRGWSAAMDGELEVRLDGAESPLYRGPAYRFLARRSQHFLEAAGLGLDAGDAFVQQDADYLPIPFARRLRVTWRGSLKAPHFYHLQLRLYPPETAVESFSPQALAAARPSLERVAERLRHPDEQCRAGAVESAGAFALGSGQEWNWTIEPGAPSAIVRLELALNAADREVALRGTLLAIHFDGASRPQVEAPCGDFFGAGPAAAPFSSLPMDGGAGALVCRFWMPMERSARIRLRNTCARQVAGTVRVRTVPSPFDDRTCYFRAKWRVDHGLSAGREPIDLPWLFVHGRGRLVGAACMLMNPSPIPTPGGSWWGEGDEKILIDGGQAPAFFGTGSEDFFNYSWSRPDLFAHPYSGQPANTGPGNAGHVSNYRFLVLDDVPFERSLAFLMELWTHAPTEPLSFARIVYHYALPHAIDDHRALQPAELVVPALPPREPLAQGGARGALFLHFEDLALDAGGAKPPASRPQPFASRHRLTVWEARHGAELSLAFAAPEPGEWALHLVAERAAGAGAFCVELDGQPLALGSGAPEIDLAAPGGVQLWDHAFARRRLEAGAHRLTLRCTRPGAIALDYLWIRKER